MYLEDHYIKETFKLFDVNKTYISVIITYTKFLDYIEFRQNHSSNSSDIRKNQFMPLRVDPSGQGVGLLSLGCWDRGFESR
jgi:hypothetical protein